MPPASVIVFAPVLSFRMMVCSPKFEVGGATAICGKALHICVAVGVVHVAAPVGVPTMSPNSCNGASVPVLVNVVA